MRKKWILRSLLCIALALVGVNPAGATSITIEGDYVLTAISDDGTLGAGGGTYPGIRHDATGTGTFPALDYLTPGSPWEMFGIRSDQTGLVVNNNSNGGANTDPISISTLLDISATSLYDHHVTTTGSYGSYFTISTDYFFNDGDERISMTSTITANTDLTGLKYLRALDPDQDSYSAYSGAPRTASTNNGRGYDSNGDGDYDDPGDLATEDWVHSVGPYSGLAIGLYTNSSYTHNTGVSSGWSSDPNYYLAGYMSGNGDYTIGLAFDFGVLNAGDAITFDYAYVMGDRLDTVDIPAVPEPATVLLMAAGLIGLAGTRRKMRR